MSKPRRASLVLIVAGCLSGVAAQPGPAWKRLLSQDLVFVNDGKMIFEEHNLCKLPGGSGQFQISTRSEAPAAGIVSRDNFVALTTSLFTTVLLAQAATGASDEDDPAVILPDCKPLETPIGKVDFELRLTMTSDGLQLEFSDKSANTSTTSTSLWSELYGE